MNFTKMQILMKDGNVMEDLIGAFNNLTMILIIIWTVGAVKVVNQITA